MESLLALEPELLAIVAGGSEDILGACHMLLASNNALWLILSERKETSDPASRSVKAGAACGHSSAALKPSQID